MKYSKRFSASLLLLQVLFTQAKGSCEILSEGTIVHCSGKDITNLTSALGGVKECDSVVLLFVGETGLEEIHENTTTRSFTELTIRNNKSLTTIDPMAFSKSNSLIERLVIMECPNLTKNSVWEVVSKMPKINYLKLDDAALTKVPEKGFEECKSLNNIYLSNNCITTFEASVGGRDLVILDLQNNQLTKDSFSEGVFEGKGHITELVLRGNPSMMQLEENQFERLLAKGTNIWVGRSQLDDNKYMKCVGADWLCSKKTNGEFFYETVFGYECIEPKFETIVDYCKSLE